MYSSCSCWPWWMTLPYVHFFSSSLTQSPTVQLLFKLVPASERSVPELTLLGTLSLHLALIRMRVTPAWPYLAAVCRAVSPYWNRGNRFSLLFTCQTCHSRRKSILETWQKKPCFFVVVFFLSHPFHFCPLADKLNLSFLFFLFLWGPSAEQGFHLKYSLLPFSNIGASPSSLFLVHFCQKKKREKKENLVHLRCASFEVRLTGSSVCTVWRLREVLHVTHVVLQVRVDTAVQQDPGTFVVSVLCPKVQRREARLKHTSTLAVSLTAIRRGERE